MARLAGLSKNMSAFLDMIAMSEGTKNIGDDGYNVIVGGALFHDYSHHPGVLVKLRKNLSSTAAGRYQILERYAKAYIKELKLPDFSPSSQDQIAIQLIKEQGAYDDVIAGKIQTAIIKCKNIWASLPGAGYGQRENSIGRLLVAFKDFRGEEA
jgi:muramidase (phage lysozyme)